MKSHKQVADAEPGAMEFFILALIGRMGLTSLYAFRQEAGLEPGGIRSLLEQMEQRELIRRADPGKRRRRELSLTPAGGEFLQRSWKQCLRPYPDAESVLRSAWVAWLMNGPGHAAAYLEYVGEMRQRKASEIAMVAARLEASRTDPLSGYEWMRISTDSYRQNAESSAFLSISHFLKNLSSANGWQS